MNAFSTLLFSPSLELILLLVALIANILLALSVYQSDRRSATNIIFCFLSGFTTLWLLNNYVTNQIAVNPQLSELALIASRFGITFAAPMSALFFLLAHTMPAASMQMTKKTYYIVLAATALMMLLNISPYAFTGISFDGDSLRPTPGPGLVPFSIISTLFSALAVYLLLRKYMKERGVVKKQLGIVLLGILIMLALIILTILIPLLISNSLAFLSLTPLYTLIFLGMTAYAITRYQLFNIKVLVTQSLTYVIVIVLLAQIFTERTFEAQMIDTLIFLFALVFGHLLVKSVRNEVEQRQLIEKQEKELEDINRQQESLLHFVSHEVKGYLTKSEAAFAAIYSGDYGETTPQLREMSGMALEDVRKGVDTVIDILDASNLKRGTVKFAHESFDITRAVEEVVNDLAPAAKDKNIDIIFTKPVTGAFTLTGDEDKLRRHVIRNLIDNSVRYTPKGHVRVELARTDSLIRLTVSDTGVGITDEDMKHLFTEGGKGADSLKVNVHSTGYGLFIAKTIVEGHGGSIRATSEGKDKGATFIVELPIK